MTADEKARAEKKVVLLEDILTDMKSLTSLIKRSKGELQEKYMFEYVARLSPLKAMAPENTYNAVVGWYDCFFLSSAGISPNLKDLR